MDDIKLMPGKYKKEQDQKNGEVVSNKGLKQIKEGFLGLIVGWSKILVAIFIVFALVSLGLWGYVLSLENKKEALSQKIEELQGQRNLALEEDFKEMKKGIDNLKTILADRLYSTQVFSMIEDLVLPDAYFKKAQIDLNEGKLNLEASVMNYTVLAKQILVFEEDDRVEKVDVSSANMDQAGQVSSDLSLDLNKSFLKK